MQPPTPIISAVSPIPFAPLDHSSFRRVPHSASPPRHGSFSNSLANPPAPTTRTSSPRMAYIGRPSAAPAIPSAHHRSDSPASRGGLGPSHPSNTSNLPPPASKSSPLATVSPSPPSPTNFPPAAEHYFRITESTATDQSPRLHIPLNTEEPLHSTDHPHGTGHPPALHHAMLTSSGKRRRASAPISTGPPSSEEDWSDDLDLGQFSDKARQRQVSHDPSLQHPAPRRSLGHHLSPSQSSDAVSSQGRIPQHHTPSSDAVLSRGSDSSRQGQGPDSDELEDWPDSDGQSGTASPTIAPTSQSFAPNAARFGWNVGSASTSETQSSIHLSRRFPMQILAAHKEVDEEDWSKDLEIDPMTDVKGDGPVPAFQDAKLEGGNIPSSTVGRVSGGGDKSPMQFISASAFGGSRHQAKTPPANTSTAPVSSPPCQPSGPTGPTIPLRMSPRRLSGGRSNPEVASIAKTFQSSLGSRKDKKPALIGVSDPLLNCLPKIVDNMHFNPETMRWDGNEEYALKLDSDSDKDSADGDDDWDDINGTTFHKEANEFRVSKARRKEFLAMEKASRKALSGWIKGWTLSQTAGVDTLEQDRGHLYSIRELYLTKLLHDLRKRTGNT
mmetsp:Transcript_10215/g.17345  ORF Transcript_10215/g.17345 Transcript_10215/m.17345 type:complete len:612 (-) Transcript_10215:605-2440(-)